MEYLIAGIRIDIPHRFTTGAFGMALAPFAAGNKTETDAGSNRMAGPVPGTATTAAPSPSETPGTERSAPRPATSPAGTAQPDLILRTGLLAGDTAGYCELDAFDFTDADADCRFGRDTEGYLLTMTPRDGSAPARFHKAFGSPDATSDITPEHNPALFRFGLWTMFNIAALERRAVAVHSSVISLDGRAVLFLGESGTGKSTHTRLWREHIPGARLLNDDSPIIRIAPKGAAEAASAPATDTIPALQGVLACGSPWSGKTPCYRNVSNPIAGIVRLSQAPQNRIRRLRPIEAIGALHQRRQRNRMEPSAKFNTCGERRLRQFLRCIGLQKTLEEMILQYLIRQHGPAVEALPVVAAREFRGQVLQQLVKFLWTDRLEQIIVYMIPDGLLRIGEFAEAGQHNDNRIREFFVDIPCQFQSIDEGHADICDDHIRQYGFQLIKRLPAVFKYMGRRKAELFPSCVLRHGLPDKHFIFHKHDLVHTARPPLHL